jgi:NADH-quinone oxidoreductase subunit M
MLSHGITTGALFLLVGMLYDRRHTHEISEFGGLATPMPVFAAFFLFVSFASAGLPMLNSFVGEFLILNGTFSQHAMWAVFGALGVILSSVYLLWAYQRTFFGPVTHEKNRTLPDANLREKSLLWVMAAFILFMGVASPLFTSRTENTVRQVLDQMDHGDATQPVNAQIKLPDHPKTGARAR